MRGRQREHTTTSTYKRASSRDRLNGQDREDGLGLGGIDIHTISFLQLVFIIVLV